MKAQQLRDMAIEEIEAQMLDAQRELFQIVNTAHSTKKAEKPHLKKQKRKEIARMKTVLHSKKQEGAA